MEFEKQQKEIVVELKAYLPRFISGLKEIIKWFHQGEEEKALKNMSHVVEGTEWIIEVLNLTNELYYQPIDTKQINPFLLKVNEGLERSDSLLIADILEYEITPIIEEWSSKINAN